MKIRTRFVFYFSMGCLALVWLNNTSMFTPGRDRPLLIAHRGLAPEMNPEHEDYMACLARIYDIDHAFIENTIPSIDAAFGLGADYVEIDVRLTADGQFAVFHDAVLDCKTAARGRVSDHSMVDLKKLDVGYGYFTEDGKHPLRGKGVGLMPSLDEVLNRFPARRFVINIKSSDKLEANRLTRYLVGRHEDTSRYLVFGGPAAIDEIREAQPSVRAVSRKTARACLRDYMLLGWSGYVPQSCRNTAMGMYANLSWILWGWPHRLVDRMQRVNTMVILTHPYQTESIHALPETPAYAEMIPEGFGGAVNTNRIDKIQEWMSASP